MATINQVEITDYTAQKLNYTSRDYSAILDDLINSIPGITEKWETSDINDPGMVLVKLIAMLGDMINYEQDMQSLEIYPSTVTQRKNAASIYKLIGYKMHWYKSATLYASVVNTYSHAAYLPKFCTFSTEDGSITYSTIDYYDLPSNVTNNGNETLVELVQGIPVTPVRVTSNPYPESGAEWHSIYGYNYTINDITSANRIYLPDNNIDQDHIFLVDDNGNEWELQDNIYLTTNTGRFFEFDVDVNDKPYIELIDYWKNYNITKFKIFYLRSAGENGEIYNNTLKQITGSIWSRINTSSGETTYNVSNFVNFTHQDSTLGYNPETPDEARKESVKYINTLNTLITLGDFERATLRIPGVANVRATDLTNDPGIVNASFYLGDINMDGDINADDLTLLENYLTDPTTYPLTAYQKRLADVNQDTVITNADKVCLQNYINEVEDPALTGYTGKKKIDAITTLKNFVVKLYILRYPEYEQMSEGEEELFILNIQNELKDYKILPLTIDVDLHSIIKYYWTIKGSFMTTEPLTRDELQTIIVNINTQLKYAYAVDKVNFNTAINYRDIVDTILALDNRILMVDLEPITYEDTMGVELFKEDLIGKYTQTVEKLQNPDPADNLVYDVILNNTPILPGSVMLRINGGEYTLRDNNNGEITNSLNILAKNGTVDYLTGKIHIELNTPFTQDLLIDYTKNVANVAVYKNLSTQSFFFDSSSLKKEATY